MKKKLLIVQQESTALYYKMICVLKNHFDITLIFLTKIEENPMEDYKKLGVKVYSFNLMGQRYLKDKKFFSGVKEGLKFILSFIRIRYFNKYDFVCAMCGEGVGYFLFKTTFKIKKIWFPYDFQIFIGGMDRKKRGNFEIKSEKYCFENADFIIHKGPENELDLIKKNEISIIKGKFIQFIPYCFDDWIMPIKKEKDKLKGLHLVYLGTGAFSPNTPYLKIKPKEIFKSILDQSINLHLYPLGGNDEIPSKYFHVHKVIPNLDLNKIIGEYHYGFCLAFYNDLLDKRLLKTAISNKLFSYLEAGIPVIINEEIEFSANIVRKYGCGVVISEKDLPNLKKILKKQNYSKLLQGVEKAREELKLSKQSERIINELLNK